MVQDDAPWVSQHGAIYQRILAALEANPVKGTASDFLADRALPLMREIFDHSAYAAPDSSGSVKYSLDVRDGTPAIFWDGAKLVTRPYNAHEHALSDFKNIGRKLMEFGDATILDIGAGTSIQAIALRALGCQSPVISLDLFPDALSIGKKLCSSLGIRDVMFGAADLTLPSNTWPPWLRSSREIGQSSWSRGTRSTRFTPRLNTSAYSTALFET